MLAKSLKIFTCLLLLTNVSFIQKTYAWDMPSHTKEIGIGAAIGAVAGEFVYAPFMGAALGGGLALATQMWGKMKGGSNLNVGSTDIQVMNFDNETILIVPTDVIFEANTAEFRPGAGQVLDGVAEILSRYPKENIHISANSDPINSGLKWHNDFLSDQQAEQIAGYLWMKGIHSGNLHRQLSYCGDESRYPIASNGLLAGMTKNRRIQIMIYSHQLSDYPKSASIKTEWSNWSDFEGDDFDRLNLS